MSKWPIVRLADVCTVVIGRTPRRDTPDYWHGNRIWVTVSELNGQVIEDSKEHITDRAVTEVMGDPIVPGTLLFSFKLSIGKMGIAGVPLFTNEAIAALPIRRDDLVLRNYLRYALMLISRKVDTNEAVLGRLLNKKTVEDLPVPLPPLPEQERISQTLDEAVALCRLRAVTDDRTSQLTEALFERMFGSPLASDKGRDGVTLGSLGMVVTGNTPSRTDSSFYGDYIEWVKTDNIDPLRSIVRPSVERLSETGAVRGRIVPEGSVLITCIAGSIERVGDAAITDRKVAINQQINAIIPNENVHSTFLGELIRALKPLIQRRATGVMTRIINKSELEAIPAISPPFSGQRRFAELVAEVRELQKGQAACRQRLDDLFESLLSGMFQGEI